MVLVKGKVGSSSLSDVDECELSICSYFYGESKLICTFFLVFII